MFVIGEVIIEMLIPYLVGILIDNGIMKGDMSYISKMGLLLLVLTIISLILGASASYVSAHAAAGFAANLRQDMFYHMQDYSFENIDHFSSASLVTRLTTDVNNVQMAYQWSSELLLEHQWCSSFQLLCQLLLVRVYH